MSDIERADDFRSLALTALENLRDSLSDSDGLAEHYEQQIMRYSALATMEYTRLALMRNRPIVTQVGRPDHH